MTALRSQLSWIHLREIIALDDPLERRFYAELCRLEKLEHPDPPALATLGDEGRMTADLVFRDPYVLDLLGFPADFSERELEAAILRELEAFLLELEQGFSFIAPGRKM